MDKLPEFVWHMQVVQNPEGVLGVKTRDYNTGIRLEIIIMQMKAFLKSLEDDYYHTFGKSSDRKNG